MSDVRRISDGSVVLRDVAESDGEAIFEFLTSDPDIARWTRIPWPYTRAHLHDFMALAGRARRARSDVVLAIADPDDDRFLGCIGLHRIGARPVPRSAMLPDEIGYWIAQEARGRGLVTQAVRLVSAYALGPLGVEHVNLQTKVGNLASQRVAEKAGYRYVGRVSAIEVDDDTSDHDRFAMTLDDYERANGPIGRTACLWDAEGAPVIRPSPSNPASVP